MPTRRLPSATLAPLAVSPSRRKNSSLATMTGASDFKGTLDLYNGVLSESGGGMTARIYVRADSDELILDVTGADPASMQTATVSLWSGRAPNPQASGAIATLSETWPDNSEPGSSGQTFGSLVALTAGGEHVKASTQGTLGITSMRRTPWR
jgi:hypothetical protein